LISISLNLRKLLQILNGKMNVYGLQEEYIWSTLLQSVLIGKVAEVTADNADFDKVQAAILKAFQLATHTRDVQTKD
jgi:hypothetical protein